MAVVGSERALVNVGAFEAVVAVVADRWLRIVA